MSNQEQELEQSAELMNESSGLRMSLNPQLPLMSSSALQQQIGYRSGCGARRKRFGIAHRR